MHHHFIIELLGIKDKNVDVWEITQEANELLVELHTNIRRQQCPICKNKTKRVHSYRTQPIQGPILANITVKITLRKPTVITPFMKDYKWVDHYQRCTNAVQTTALTYSALSSFTTAAHLAGITTNRLIRIQRRFFRVR